MATERKLGAGIVAIHTERWILCWACAKCEKKVPFGRVLHNRNGHFFEPDSDGFSYSPDQLDAIAAFLRELNEERREKE